MATLCTPNMPPEIASRETGANHVTVAAATVTTSGHPATAIPGIVCNGRLHAATLNPMTGPTVTHMGEDTAMQATATTEIAPIRTCTGPRTNRRGETMAETIRRTRAGDGNKHSMGPMGRVPSGEVWPEVHLVPLELRVAMHRLRREEGTPALSWTINSARLRILGTSEVRALGVSVL